METKETNEKEKDLTISAADIVPYVKKIGEDIIKKTKEMHCKLGDRYNRKNVFEEMYRRFKDPAEEPEAFAAEYFKIIEKKSTLPAAVRYTVSHICTIALNQCYADKLMEQRKSQE